MTAGLVAGLIGCGAGLAAAWTWSALHHWNLVVLPTLPLLAIGGSLAASAAGGLAPALRAASVSPLTAMRS
jgi:ABC-type antimicrobial peptide transport system permease subunit